MLLLNLRKKNLMHTIAVAVLLFTSILSNAALANSCRAEDDYPHYMIEAGAVFYKNVGTKSVPDADPTTFQVIPLPPHPLSICENPKTEIYARDKNSVFFHGERLVGADPKTFVVRSEELGHDKDFEYDGSKRIGTTPKE
jgi:hypothetical protein